MSLNYKKITSLIFVLIFLSSCVETIIGGSLTAAYLSTREKSLSATASDIRISSIIGTDFVINGLKNIGNYVDITVNEGRVLLTGIVRDSNKAKEAIDLAWKVDNVKEVIDEIQIAKDLKLRPKDFSNSLIDYGLTAKIEAKLAINEKVKSKNYKITTVAKTVYLLGVAQDRSEINNVLQKISHVIGVERVVNHVILKDDPRRVPPRSSAAVDL